MGVTLLDELNCVLEDSLLQKKVEEGELPPSGGRGSGNSEEMEQLVLDRLVNGEFAEDEGEQRAG